MPYSTESGLNIYYEVSGSGPAMVLVHANPFDRRLFLYQVARFSMNFTVVTVDIRGYGFSDKPETPFTLEDMTDDVIGVCKTEGIDQAIFGGVSVGSGIAMIAGLDHPEMTRGLILIGGTNRGGPRIEKYVDAYLGPDFAGYRRSHMAACFAPGFTETPLGAWVMTTFNENSDDLSPQSIAQIFRARAGATLTHRLKDIQVPSLVINGEFDMSMDSGKETASLIPGAKHAVIPGTGHACCIEDPTTFDNEVINFLKDSDLWT